MVNDCTCCKKRILLDDVMDIYIQHVSSSVVTVSFRVMLLHIVVPSTVPGPHRGSAAKALSQCLPFDHSITSSTRKREIRHFIIGVRICALINHVDLGMG